LCRKDGKKLFDWINIQKSNETETPNEMFQKGLEGMTHLQNKIKVS